MRTKFYQLLKGIGFSFKNKINSLTLYETLSLLISFVGVLSLVFIYIQTMQATANMELSKENMDLSKKNMELSTASMQASMYATMNIQTLEMDKIFLEHSDLRPYFYNNKALSEIPDENTLRKVMIIAEYQLDYFDLVMTQLDYIPIDKDFEEDKATWNKYFADSFANSPALCKRIADKPGWYMTKLRNISEENCKNPG